MDERVRWRHPPTEVRCAGNRYFFVERRHISPTSTSTGNAKGAGAQLLLRSRHGRSTQRTTVISCLMRSLFRGIPVAIYSESAVTLFGTEHFPEL
jgi:hypothetical protein